MEVNRRVRPGGGPARRTKKATDARWRFKNEARGPISNDHAEGLDVAALRVNRCSTGAVGSPPRLVVGDREADDDDRGHGGLAGSEPVARARRWCRLVRAEGGGQQALAAHGERVAGDDVVEAEQGGEHAGDEQDVEHVGEGVAEP